jgi:hypothetical protein
LVHNSGDSRGSRAHGPTFAVAPITGGAFGAAAVSF